LERGQLKEVCYNVNKSLGSMKAECSLTSQSNICSVSIFSENPTSSGGGG